ncbi:MAG: alkaline phosphatase family protein [Phycisphaerales bacterium]|nr:alkaline phosphatase family protein [Phycisphaerales bacterium]
MPPETPPHFGKVLLIGLDGATFDVLGPLMKAGKMPELQRLVDEGVSGPLESTRPPITPAAWTTFMTGKGPGKHGIIDFVRYEPKQDSLGLNNNQEINSNTQTIWEILSNKGYRVGSINVPMTYPPIEVNGFMISGFDTPPNRDFTYPKELQKEILEKFPDYTHEKKWQRKASGGDDLFEENLNYIKDSFDRGYHLAEMCGEKYGWDVMMVLYKLVDNLQHKAWRYIDERTKHNHPKRAALTEECWIHLDRVLGKLRALADRHEAHIVIMSDHGHGSLDGKAQPNLLLSNWGYLKLRGLGVRARGRVATWIRRLRGKPGAMSAGGLGDIGCDPDFDWANSRACVLHAGVYGFLYINLKGRQPNGIVEPKDFERLRQEIREKLLGATCKDREGREMKIFTDVFVTEELYGCSREEHPWMPDLLLAPADGLAVVKKIRGAESVRWVPFKRLEGTHRLDGVFTAWGPAIKRKLEMRAHIADLAPTILAGLGEPVPKDMDGNVLESIFEQPINIVFEPSQDRRIEETVPSLTADQERDITNRLEDLGYLD